LLLQQHSAAGGFTKRLVLQTQTGWATQAAVKMHPGAHEHMYKRSQNESCVADILLGQPINSLGRFDRQPYWLTRSIVSFHHWNRTALSVTTPWPSMHQPMLTTSQTSHQVLRLAATLLHLSFHRYGSVAFAASAALQTFSSVISDGILLRAFPQVISAATLVRERSVEAGTAALLLEGSAVEGSAEDGDAELSKSLNQLSALMVPALKGASSGVGPEDGSRASASSKGSTVAAEAGVCTTENKHLVMGALQLMQAHSGMISALCRRSAVHFVVLYMAVFVMQSFTLPVCSDLLGCGLGPVHSRMQA
jgi:hypothetical protein